MAVDKENVFQEQVVKAIMGYSQRGILLNTLVKPFPLHINAEKYSHIFKPKETKIQKLKHWFCRLLGLSKPKIHNSRIIYKDSDYYAVTIRNEVIR